MLYSYLFIMMQIVLESIPVSSSGHLALLTMAFEKSGYYVPALTAWYQLLHGSTLIIVVLFFYKQWTSLLGTMRRTFYYVIYIFFLTVCADIMTVAWYLVLRATSWQTSFPLGAGFIITALLLFSLCWVPQRASVSLNMARAVALGFVQGIALVPGISRFAATYAAARWFGIQKRRALEISFLIEFPLITLACMQSAWLFFVQHEPLPVVGSLTTALIIGSSLIAWYALCFVAFLMDHNYIWLLGFYMLIPCLGWWLLRA